jgi:hypothetical protein
MGKNFLLRAGKLKTDIEDLPNKSSCNQQSDMQQRVQRNQIQRLTTMLRDLVIEFKTNQGNCIEKSKSMCRKQREIVRGSLNANDASHLEDNLVNFPALSRKFFPISCKLCISSSSLKGENCKFD